MQRLADEVKEFFVPTARCFKGFSIMLAIWGCASLLICGLVPSIILVHNPLPKSQYGGDFGEGQKGGVDPIVAAYQQKSSMFGDSIFHNRYTISLQPIDYPSFSFAETNDKMVVTVDPEILDKRDKAELLRDITLGIGAGFLTISAINYIMFVKYKRMED
jgi:hypothetical protein